MTKQPDIIITGNDYQNFKTQTKEMHECRLIEIEVKHCYECPYHRPEGDETFYCADLREDILHSAVDPIKLFPRKCRFPIGSWWQD